MTRIATRAPSPANVAALIRQGLHPVLARLYAARGVCLPEEIETAFTRLVPPVNLKGASEAALLLADAIAAKRRLLVVADYDCDGATACAVAVRGLRMFGAAVDYLVPNRFEYGYGLTPEIVELAAARSPDLLITVDNGIASVDGVAAARRVTKVMQQPPGRAGWSACYPAAQLVPLSAKLVGLVSLLVQVPWNPNVTLPPGLMVAL